VKGGGPDEAGSAAAHGARDAARDAALGTATGGRAPGAAEVTAPGGSGPLDAATAAATGKAIASIVANVERVVMGKRRVVQMVLAALLARGHVLIEDVPGVGKTTLVRALARSVGCEFRRIQFTPDLLPSDITGVSVYDQKSGQFEFRPGPILSQVILADEINRTSPKTQSSLLECMEEGQVTVDGVTYPVPRPFFVLATENPIEYEGTFPLPEAQLDRFLVQVRIGYPSPEHERAMLDLMAGESPLHTLPAVSSAGEVLRLQGLAMSVFMASVVRDYILAIVQGTRRHPDVYLGASPRGGLALARLARAWALVQGRAHVLPDDIKAMAVPALAHRIIVRPEAAVRQVTAEAAVEEALRQTPVVTEGRYDHP